MFIFALQLRHALEENGHLYLFAVFSIVVWTVWAAKTALSRRYRPWSAPHETTSSVIIPVVDEPVDVFRAVLHRITRQKPTETVVVINGPRNLALEGVCAEFASAGVVCLWTPVAGKRNAVRVGTEKAVGEVLVLVDSDTVWTENVLEELLKPFADPTVGGVTTRQRILDPTRAFITRWMDWLENSRARYSMPAQSVLGQVGCLPGRTIAFRRSIVLAAMHDFMSARFLGVFLEVSDDRTLTNLTLKQGYRTVYQATALVFTDAPLSWRKLYRQQLRWARGSQYNTLRMLPWMLRRAPVLAAFFLADMLLPFLLFAIIGGALWRVATGSGPNYYAGALVHYGTVQGVLFVAVLTLLGSWLSMTLRNVRLIDERPRELLWMPVYALASTCFLMPIRLLGFCRMAHDAGWGTRADGYAGALAETTPAGAFPLAASTGSSVPRADGAAPVMAGRAPRMRNPLAALPYLLATAAFGAAALYGG